MKPVISAVTVLVLVTLFSIQALAIPETLNYQGILTDASGVPIDETKTMTFRIYDSASGGVPADALWTETQSVTIDNGVYSVQLGSFNTLVGLQFDVPYWLGVEIENDGEMTPRQPMTSVPYAVTASKVYGPLSISTDDIGGIAVRGTSTLSGAGTGVRGQGDFMGVAGYTYHDTGVGVYGQAGTTGANYGVYGYSQSSQGHAIHGKNDVGGVAGFFEGDVEVTGTINGVGSGLEELNATNLSTGTVADARLSANVAKLDTNQTVTGVKNFAPVTGTVPFTVDASKNGPVANLNSDLVDGMQASEIIAAAADEVRTPISACGTTINTSGSYYVTQNLISAGENSGLCIYVTANNVSVDLMGFTLTGDGTGAGVHFGTSSNGEVKNGTITNFSSGVQANAGSDAIRVINCKVLSNVNRGLMLLTRNVLIEGCTVSGNGAGGGTSAISIYDGNITNNIVTSNQYTGISCGTCIIEKNLIYANLGNGIYTGEGALIGSNVVYENTGSGIVMRDGSSVLNNTVSSNQLNGIQVWGPGVTLKNNTSYLNGQSGIYLASGNTLVDGNTAYNNNQEGGSSPNMTTCPTCTFGLNHAP